MHGVVLMEVVEMILVMDTAKYLVDPFGWHCGGVVEGIAAVEVQQWESAA